MDATTQGTGIRAEFTGNPRRFFRLALIGNLLQIPTFGFYRFWLITDIRRHLWSNTRLAGDSFEYTGRARELLIGFLIALAILTPLYIGYFILSIEAERTKAFASLPFALVIYVLAHYGTYRARRYRATRTIFRGVRLWMTGSGWSYAWRAILWDMLTVLSLGLALPWRAASLERFKMRHTYFGDLEGSFAGTGWSFFERGWWLWLLSVLPLVLMLGIGVAAGLAMLEEGSLGSNRGTAAALGFAILLWFPILVFGFPLYRAIEMRWWIEGIQFGRITLTSSLRKRNILWCYVKASLIGGVAMGVLGIILQTVLSVTGISFENFNLQEASAVVIASFAVFYVATLLTTAVIMLQFVTRSIWQITAGSVTVFNTSALDTVAARGAAAGSLGEGLADALDFGGGVGF
jgi:uncharacterized membrane protein YjgN (DUF898 family)